MRSKSTDIASVAFSVRAYQLLLNAYPSKFQQEYGSQMVQVFEDCCLRAIRQGGTNGMVRLWAVTLLDLIQSMISEHAQKEIEMKKEMDPEDIRLAGGALMVGAVLFVISLASGFLGDAINTDLWAVPSILIPLIIMPLFAFGMLAMRNRYGEKVGGLGKNFLLIGAVLGALTSITGLFTATRVSDLWFLIYTGPAVLFTGLALFGFVALYKKPLPRWNVAPLIAGIGYPLLLILSYMIPSMSIPDSVSIILIAIQGIALAALGYILKSDAPEATAVPV